MNERVRLCIQSDLYALKRNLSRNRDADFSPRSGQKRLSAAIQRINDRISDLRLAWPDGYEQGIHSGGMGMTDKKSILEEYDENGNGVIDPHELALIELEDRRRKMEDSDAQRDSVRKMAWFALFGLLLYPIGILVCDLLGLATAAGLIADIAPTYFASIAVLVSAFFGASAIAAKKE